MFPYISPCKTCDPRAGPFLTQGCYLNKLGRGVGDATIKALGVVVSCFPI